MSIATKTGDSGTTALMYGRRVSKTDPRVEACGSVDELNAALGSARVQARTAFLSGTLSGIQKDLITLMGELGTATEDLERYCRDGFQRVPPALTGQLDALVTRLEVRKFRGWATPGSSPAAAALDVARTTCRRAERAVCRLQETGQLANPEIIKYLNRLSDVLWLLARWVEARRPRSSPAKSKRNQKKPR